MTSRIQGMVMLVAALMLAAGCGYVGYPSFTVDGEEPLPPGRVGLTSPFPLTLGGAAIPANGVAFDGQVTRGTTGQEGSGASMAGIDLAGGLGNRVGVSVGGFDVRKPGKGKLDRPGGSNWSVWARGSPFGRHTSTKLKVTVTNATRVEPSLQDDRLSAMDVVVPTEWLWHTLAPKPPQEHPAYVGLYAGPRFTRVRYFDQLHAGQDVRADAYGGVAGVHLGSKLSDRYAVHLFAEVSLVKVPRTRYLDIEYGNRIMVAPAIGIVYEFGRPHEWP